MQLRGLLLIAAIIYSASGSEPVGPLSVCSALKQRNKLAGKLVAIRGEYRGGRFEEYISDEYGELPCPGMKRAGITWPSTVLLIDVSSITDGKNTPSSIEAEGGPLHEFHRRVGALGDASTHRIRATFIGEFKSRNSLQIICDDRGNCGGHGFGKQGRHPALLVLTNIKDVDIGGGGD